MIASKKNTVTLSWLHLLFGATLVITYFLPWVSWSGNYVAGYALASGDFFHISATQFKLDNPFPKLNFTFYAFWLVPVLGTLTVLFVSLKKKTSPFSYLAGSLSLALFVIYFLFTGTLIDLGVGKNVVEMLLPSSWIHLLAAVGIICTTVPVKSLLPKTFWLVAGPVIAYGGYKIGEKTIMAETFVETKDTKTDFTVKATELINEFIKDGSAANKKYQDKMLVVNGNATKVEVLADSSSTISFSDSTGSYVIFSLEKTSHERVKTLKQGDAVSLKGVCSGSIFSEILGTMAISFKRGTFN